MAKKLLYPELTEGKRVQYFDRNGATRDGYIVARSGNTITGEGALKRKTGVYIEKVIGYWEKRVKASPNNLIRLWGGKVL